MFSSGVLALLVLRLVTTTTATDLHIALNIENAFVAPDGFPRSVVTANGTIPGPLISGNVGDRFVINVTDSLTDPTMLRSTSIHWHGMTHEDDHSVASDGTVSVSQCPIVPGHSFQYNFTCPQQSGTYWYHSHLATQYCDGLSGPFIIYDPNDPHIGLYDIDDESTIISLSDWYHSPAPSHNTGPQPTPDSTLINGLGRWSSNPTSELAVVRAQVDKRHRFRLINSGCAPSFNFSIDQHNLTVIEADGLETEPVTVDQLQIFAGQRYSVVVAMDKPIENYWIRAIPSNTNGTTDGGINSAILRYDGAPIAEPSQHTEDDPSDESVILEETDLHPLVNPGAPGKPYPGGADVVLNLKPSYNESNGAWMINNVSFAPPSTPILLQILSGSANAKELLPAASVFGLPSNAVVEVTVPAIGDHPFHLHGHVFDVVRPAGSSTYNFENPVRRDTLSAGKIYGNDTTTFRFVADNAGPWFFHCHIDWHALHGLGVVFAEETDQVAKEDIVSDDWKSLCPLYDQLNPDKHFDS